MVQPGHRFLTARKDPRQYSHQRSFGAVGLNNLPGTLGRKVREVFDQLLTNFCTAFAYAGAMSIKLGFRVSAEFQVAQEGRIAGAPIMEGATLDTMNKAGFVFGVIRDDSSPIKLNANNAADVADWKKYPGLVSGILQGNYYNAHTGKYDAFDNIRSAIYNARQDGQDAVAIIATPWYREFNDAGARDGVVSHIPSTASIADHAYAFYDWEPDGNGDYNALCLLSNGKNFGNGGVFRFSRNVINFLFANPVSDSRLTDDRDLNEGSKKARIIQKLLIAYYEAIQIINELLALQSAKKAPSSPVAPVVAPDTTPTVPESEAALLWDTAQHAYHSVRVICDQEDLTVARKNDVCACIYQESQFNNDAVHKNVGSTDYGIVQVNDYWHIGPGKDFPSVAYVRANPEACVRWMARLAKAGKLSLWSSYVSGDYEQWLVPSSPMWELKA